MNGRRQRRRTRRAAPLARTNPRAARVVTWNGPVRPYDILKEATIALVVVTILVVILAVLFSSPDVPPVTLQAWASAQPVHFTEVALSELEGVSTSATYGPPYNHASGSVQVLFGVSIQRAFGVTDPIDPARSFVLGPLATASGQPRLTRALAQYKAASHAEQMAWDRSYGRALVHARIENSKLVVPPADDGPVPEMLGAFLAMTRSGGLDAQLVEHASFYGTNYTKPILFLGDSATAQEKSYWNELASAQRLQGSQWGMMNETGSWPGQPWLWLYTMWYQVGPMASSANADVEVVGIMTLLSLGLVFLPFIPGLRDIPKALPVHRLIWRDYYRASKQPED